MVTLERWVVYATFDAEGLAAPFVEDQLAAYRQIGFKTLVVDASPHPSPERVAAWERSSTVWRLRVNTGYDFGSYREGLSVLLDERKIAPDRLDLLLTNDSCYGPYTPLVDVFRAFDANPRNGTCVFGLSDSEEISYHLQSYWLYFRADVIRHVVDFFAGSPPILHRQDAVEHGEIGLSRLLLKQGCVLVPLHAVQAVVRHFARFNGWLPSLIELSIRWRARRPRYTWNGDRACLKALLGRPFPFMCNQVIAFGTHLHYESMTPFVKRQLVRENPNNDPFIPAVPPADPRDNACIYRWLRSTDRYRRRYGRTDPPASP